MPSSTYSLRTAGRQVSRPRLSITRNKILQEYVRITDVVTLDNVLSTAMERKRDAARVQFLHLIFHQISPPAHKIRLLLRQLKNVVVLELIVPFASKSKWVRLLQGVQLDQLETFSTTSPHAALSIFLRNHPRVKNLKIDGCAAPVCELEDLHLPSLIDVSGPAPCVTAVMKRNSVERVYATRNDGDLPHLPRFFNSLSTSIATLSVLHLDFDPTDRDILSKIGKAAPFLTALKLTETSLPYGIQRGSRFRRAWNHASQWKSGLLLLPRLSRLLLKTAAPLVTTPGDQSQEAILVSKWTHTKRRSGMRDEHPTLQHLTLWYLSDSDSSYLCYWSQAWKDGVWARTGSISQPPPEAFV
ncbi:hypothetical protein BJ138DRAFT_1128715 [Hygrophoropsis aurantiaca]|uniref:Uncharacterized protein n=1 Tax=Hygrophoropsis aurantiaca TaxID=72124 RepID=A0ACB8A4W3_9AGAM|nr:hypothetical protein BJ138DRAFT_1128715 [Hygrophoropsis aurantiaca]